VMLLMVESFQRDFGFDDKDPSRKTPSY